MSVNLERRTGSNHAVHFYGSDEGLIETIVPYLSRAIKDGDAAVIIATPEHVDAFRSALSSTNADLGSAVRNGRVLILDAEETLSSFMALGSPDKGAFDDTIGQLVRDIRKRGTRAVAFGEMVALLWEQGNVAGAIELEILWNNLLEEEDFSLYCAYPERIINDPRADELHTVCVLHSEILGSSPLEIHSDSRLEERRLECSNGSPREARVFVSDVLNRWGHEHLIEDLLMVATELVTNSVLHARTELVLSLSATSKRVRVSVADRSSKSPAPVTGSERLESSGRGLILVDALAHDWGVDLEPDGKRVWAEFLVGRRA